jgi:hypothetical protein
MEAADYGGDDDDQDIGPGSHGSCCRLGGFVAGSFPMMIVLD